MATTSEKPKIVVIVGLTASGKSDLAMSIAKRHRGEIIAADSRTVYKDMDIGTAKPSKSDQAQIRHWGLDLIKPGQKFSAFQFKQYASDKIAEIQARGNLPIVVGGTGLYIDALLFDFSFVQPSTLNRLAFKFITRDKLQKIIYRKGWPMPENYKNKRYLLNTAMRKGTEGSRKYIIDNSTLVIGLMPDDETLRKRINKRAEQIFARGVLEETRKLKAKYGKRRLERTAGIVYKLSLNLLAGEINPVQALAQFQAADWQYARRQRTLFRRNPYIEWFKDSKPAQEYVNTLLNK